MTFPVQRLGRLRRKDVLRSMVQDVRISREQLIYPVFVRSGKAIREPVASMPGIHQFSEDQLLVDLEELAGLEVPAILIFGIPGHRDDKASGALSARGVVQSALKSIRKEFPHLYLITDVCLCSYTRHGHCGLLKKRGRTSEIALDNDATLEVLAGIAVSHAEAGADMVAPSGMMDGMVGSIRGALDSKGFAELPIISYAAKYASSFYGPFRDAAESAPQFGNRNSYQMNYRNKREALREVSLDIEEGADIVMVKPALAYLDIIGAARAKFDVPLAAYHVSGEYSMIKAAAQAGWINEKDAVMETHAAAARAGADMLITYWAKDLARWLRTG